MAMQKFNCEQRIGGKPSPSFLFLIGLYSMAVPYTGEAIIKDFKLQHLERSWWSNDSMDLLSGVSGNSSINWLGCKLSDYCCEQRMTVVGRGVTIWPLDFLSLDSNAQQNFWTVCSNSETEDGDNLSSNRQQLGGSQKGMRFLRVQASRVHPR